MLHPAIHRMQQRPSPSNSHANADFTEARPARQVSMSLPHGIEREHPIGHIAHAFHEGRFMWIGGGDYACSVCHVDNLASAVARAVENGQGGKAYFVTDDDLTSMRRFFTDVVEASGQPAPRRGPRHTGSEPCSRE